MNMYWKLKQEPAALIQQETKETTRNKTEKISNP